MRDTNGVATIKTVKNYNSQRIEMLIHPLQAEEFMNIVSEKTGTNMINVDKVLQLGKQPMMLFKYLPKDLLPVLQKNSGYNEEK